MGDSLKNCPNCGKATIVCEPYPQEYNSYYAKVFCDNKRSCKLAVSYGFSKNSKDSAKNSAIKHWNERIK